MKKETKTLYQITSLWLRKPENILLCLILLVGTIIGIIDDNLKIIIIVYVFAFLYGHFFGLLFYIKDKIFKRKE